MCGELKKARKKKKKKEKRERLIIEIKREKKRDIAWP